MVRYVYCLFLLLFVSTAAAAEMDERSLTALVADLGAKSFSQKAKAVEALAATGDHRALAVLEAMLERRLFTRKSDNRVVIAVKAGKKFEITAPLTQEKIATVTKGALKKVRINNRLRQQLKGSIGSLSLRHKDPARRIAAADAVFKSRPAAMIAPLRAALQSEPNDDVKAHLSRAIASAELAHAKEPATRLAAINTLAEFGGLDIGGLLKGLLLKRDDGTFAEANVNVRAAAQAVLDEVERSAAFWATVESLFQGISLGSVLLLAAIGLAITFGVMGVINMAHGEMVMLGAYTTFVVQEIFRAYAPHLFDLSLFAAIPAAFLVAGLVGVAIERGVIQFLYGRPLETLLATWGISLILQQLVRSIFGPTNREVGSPSWMQGAFETASGITLTYNRVAIIFFSLGVLLMLLLVLRKTWFGLQMRAVTQNRPMASAMGIRTGWVDAMTFGLGSGIAGIAGVALSQVDNVSPNLGQAYIIDSFLVVVFGGVGNLWGTLVGAMSLGIANKFLEPYAGAVLGKIFVLVAVILFIQKRPRGLFALKGRVAES
ncbi:MAG: urea ABC transporter permease subunit UrtB [Alphaproteobacteria bacterium]|nr:urea ABC transporter permease subunit UrtB [Alphaproteobacteria bacterium]